MEYEYTSSEGEIKRNDQALNGIEMGRPTSQG
jgi:hypothetical protein